VKQTLEQVQEQVKVLQVQVLLPLQVLPPPSLHPFFHAP
jgi:hypothetical protein